MVRRVWLATLLLAATAHGADWALPPVSTAVGQADAIVVAKVTADAADGKFRRWDVTVEETLKGVVAQQTTVTRIDAGDPQGEKSPFPPVADPVGKRVVVFLKGNDAKVALSRYVVDGDAIVFLGDPEGQKWTLAQFRTAVTQLSLLQAAAKTPELATPAYRMALQSKIDEVLWWGASNLLRQGVTPAMKGEIEAALQAAPEKGKARKALEQCLKKAGGNSP